MAVLNTTHVEEKKIALYQRKIFYIYEKPNCIEKIITMSETQGQGISKTTQEAEDREISPK